MLAAHRRPLRGAGTAELVRVGPDELLLFEPWMTTEPTEADAFACCRVAADGKPR